MYDDEYLDILNYSVTGPCKFLVMYDISINSIIKSMLQDPVNF